MIKTQSKSLFFANVDTNNKKLQIRKQQQDRYIQDKFQQKQHLFQIEIWESSQKVKKEINQQNFYNILRKQITEDLKNSDVQNKNSNIKFYQQTEKRYNETQNLKFKLNNRQIIETRPKNKITTSSIIDDFYTNNFYANKTHTYIATNQQVIQTDQKTFQKRSIFQVDEYDLLCSLFFCENKNQIISGTQTGCIEIFDIEKQRRTLSKQFHNGSVITLDYDDTLLSGSEDQTIQQYDFRLKQQIVQSYYNHKSDICKVKWAPFSKQFASGGNDNKVFIYDCRSIIPLNKFTCNGAVRAIDWSKLQMNTLAFGGASFDQNIYIYNTSQNKLMKKQNFESPIYCLTYMEDKIAISQQYCNEIFGFDIIQSKSLKKLQTVQAHKKRILDLYWNKDNEQIVSQSSDCSQKYWQLNQKSQTKQTVNFSIFDNICFRQLIFKKNTRINNIRKILQC